MSDELIRRQLTMAPRSNEADLRTKLLAAAQAMRAAVAAYAGNELLFPLPMLGDCIPPDAPPAAFHDARLRANREAIIHELPKSGVGVEVGTQTGAFARKLIDIAQPRILHVIDISYEQFDHTLFSAAERKSLLTTHQGLSWEVMAGFADAYFDWIYIDASHAYEDVCRDIAVSRAKLKPAGYLIFNDYTTWSPLEAMPYGIARAVNELLLTDSSFSAAYLGLHTLGYHDLALRRTSA